MCVSTPYRRSKSTRPTTTTSPKQKPSKQVKTCHPKVQVDAESNKENKQQQTQTKKRKQPKSVSFNEVVVVRPHSYDVKAEKSVSFHEVVMVRPVLHLTDYTDEEVVASWYLLEDKQRIKAEILNTLKLAKEIKNNSSFSSLDSSCSSEDDEACTRGLEKLSDGGRTRERRRISIREVLEEQELQRESHQSDKSFSYDNSKFRKIYKPYSRAARHHAHAVGLMDQMAVCENVDI